MQPRGRKSVSPLNDSCEPPGKELAYDVHILIGRMEMKLRTFAALPVLFLASQLLAADAATFSVGDKIEVREGDTWSKAAVVAREGRKFQVQYEGADQTKEW